MNIDLLARRGLAGSVPSPQGNIASPVEIGLPPGLKRAFRIIAFDWDGTAVPSRRHPADEVIARVNPLLRADIRCVVITGTNFPNIDSQFTSRLDPHSRRHVYVCANRGSEVFGFDEAGETVVLHRREATPEENRAMDEVATGARDELRERYGLVTEVIFNRLNRRKLDLIPVPEWADPPKEMIARLLEAVEVRLASAGVPDGIKGVIKMVEARSRATGFDFRITTDVKHVEVGLTDKRDSVVYIMHNIAAPAGIRPCEVLFLGDEFGPVGGFEGSDSKMIVACAEGAVFASVGAEPGGVPEGVIRYGRGAPGFLEILDCQLALHRA
ncbi:MAG: hypothetical protein AB1774_06235 [Bacillota bacterium]